MLTFPGQIDDTFPDRMGGEPIIVTKHAAKRWRERVRPCTAAQARTDILTHATAIRSAASIGADIVRLGSRHRLVLQGLTVVTVLGPTRFSWDRF